MTTHWNAGVYDAVGKPQAAWAARLIDDLKLVGNEIVMDAGCGSGVVTLELAERLPQGRIYAVDSSSEMIEGLKAKMASGKTGCEIVPILSSLTETILPEQVDVVFSNAVFHWILDDEGLFGNLFRLTRPGGRIRAQCGGAGNLGRLYQVIKSVQQVPPFNQFFHGFYDAKKYRSESEASASLEQAGWKHVRTQLFQQPVEFDARDACTFMRHVIVRDHMPLLPEELRQAYVDKIVEFEIARHGKPFVADYVRLDIWADR